MTKLIDQFPKEKLDRVAESKLAKSDPTSLVMHSMREALLYTQRVCRDRIPENERVSICYQKLTACVNRFRPGGIRFIAFAKAGLRGAMKDYWTAKNTVRNAKEIISADVLGGWSPDRPGRREEIGSEDESDSIREPITDEITHPETDAICSRDRWAEVEKLVGPSLNSRQRMVLALVYKAGLNYPQIGKLLGVTRSLVHSVHRDALKQIRSLIAEDGRLLKE